MFLTGTPLDSDGKFDKKTGKGEIEDEYAREL